MIFINVNNVQFVAVMRFGMPEGKVYAPNTTDHERLQRLQKIATHITGMSIF